MKNFFTGHYLAHTITSLPLFALLVVMNSLIIIGAVFGQMIPDDIVFKNVLISMTCLLVIAGPVLEREAVRLKDSKAVLLKYLSIYPQKDEHPLFFAITTFAGLLALKTVTTDSIQFTVYLLERTPLWFAAIIGSFTILAVKTFGGVLVARTITRFDPKQSPIAGPAATLFVLGLVMLMISLGIEVA